LRAPFREQQAQRDQTDLPGSGHECINAVAQEKEKDGMESAAISEIFRSPIETRGGPSVADSGF
jgi:hypothetical protein